MAIQVINIGTSPNKGDGEPLRTAFDKINDNFSELSLKVTNLETGGVTVTTGDIKGSVFGDDSTLLVDGVNSTIPSANLSGALPAIDGSALTGLFSGAYADLTGKPTLFSGAYGDLTGSPTNVSTFTNDSGYLTSVPAQTFVSLTDSPANFTGQAGKFVKVNAGENALEFDTVAGGGITDIIQDTTPQLGGNLDLNSKNVTGTGNVNITGSLTATSGTLGAIQLIDNNIKSTDSTQLSIQTPTSFTNAGAPGVTIDGNITFEATGAITGPTVDIYGIGNGQVKIGNTGSSVNPVKLGNANTDVSVEGDLTVDDEAKFQRGVQHKYSTIDSATGVTAHDCNNGQFFRHTNIQGDITVNLTNLNLNNGYSTEIVLFIEQGVSARNVIALQIAGQAQTFHVQSGQTVNTNTKDTILIKIWRTGTGSTDYIAMREIYNH
tara:strand:- start:12475 stop:13779 length:1305 start_codon:yes stop_codon:yes gene_type:complete